MRRHLTSLKMAGAVIVLVVVLIIVLIRVPSGNFPGSTSEYVLLPDIAHPVAPLVQVKGAKKPKGSGTIYFVDVIERRASTFEELFHSVDSHATFLPASEIVPPGSNDTAVVQAELREMSMSQQIAAAVAERKLGYHVVIHANGVLVNVLDLGTPASRKLESADVIEGVDGTATPTVSKLHEFMSGIKPGATVTLKVRRGAKTLELRVQTFALKQDPAHALIGFEPAQAAQITLPVKVAIHAGGIGGPSAGLSFALEVMQQLGHNVTHGYNVAATGEMELDGSVAPIGGVKQKTYGVREAGADVFLVPAGQNAKDARQYAGSLKIIAVRSLGQALHALATLPPKR